MRLSLWVAQLQVERGGVGALLHHTGRNWDSSLKTGRLSRSRSNSDTINIAMLCRKAQYVGHLKMSCIARDSHLHPSGELDKS